MKTYDKDEVHPYLAHGQAGYCVALLWFEPGKKRQCRRPALDVVHTGDKLPREVVLEPNYENTAFFFALGLRHHNFDKGATDPVISFIEQIRYLAQTDLPAIERIIQKLR